jgi:tetratricopeptide (TPR) repeat protein
VPDPGGRIARQFRVETTPALFLLDGAGRVAFQLDGFRSEDEQGVVEAVRDLVGDTPAPAAPVVPARRADSGVRAEPAPAAPAAPPPRVPDDPRRQMLERYRYFGGYHFNRRELDKAEESYGKYLALAPEDVEIWLRYGEVLARQRAYDRAREAWEQVLRLEPGNAEADAQIRKLIRGEY